MPVSIQTRKQTGREIDRQSDKQTFLGPNTCPLMVLYTLGASNASIASIVLAMHYIYRTTDGRTDLNMLFGNVSLI